MDGASGGRWRDLQDRLGSYQTVKRRYYRWVENGVLDRLFEAISADAGRLAAIFEMPVVANRIRITMRRCVSRGRAVIIICLHSMYSDAQPDR
jgi:transposase